MTVWHDAPVGQRSVYGMFQLDPTAGTIPFGDRGITSPISSNYAASSPNNPPWVPGRHGPPLHRKMGRTKGVGTLPLDAQFADGVLVLKVPIKMIQDDEKNDEYGESMEIENRHISWLQWENGYVRANAMETMQNGPSSETWITADQEISIYYSYVKLPRGNVIQGCAQHLHLQDRENWIKLVYKDWNHLFFSCLWWSNTEFFAICSKLVLAIWGINFPIINRHLGWGQMELLFTQTAWLILDRGLIKATAQDCTLRWTRHQNPSFTVVYVYIKDIH